MLLFFSFRRCGEDCFDHSAYRIEVIFGHRDEDVLSAIAARLVRLDRELTPNHRTALPDAANGQTLATIAGSIVSPLDPDWHTVAGRVADHLPSEIDPNEENLAKARRLLLNQVAKPLAANPALRMVQSFEQFLQTQKDEIEVLHNSKHWMREVPMEN